MTKQSMVIPCLTEYIACALFLFLGSAAACSAKLNNLPMSLTEICLIWGLSISLSIFISAKISGGHLNPAVTIIMWLLGGFDGKRVVPYIIAQTAGCMTGAALSWYLYKGAFTIYLSDNSIDLGSAASLPLAGLFTTYPASYISVMQAGITEFIITAILLFSIFILTDKRFGTENSVITPLIIGVIVTLIGVATGPLTGFAMNPARDFGPKIFCYLAGWGDIAFTGNRQTPYFIVPLTAPLLGALVGGLFYKIGFSPKPERQEESTSTEA